MKSNATKLILIGLFFSSYFGLLAEDSNVIEFNSIWEKIKQNSHSQKALSLESRAAKISSNKASKHWLPRVYADARNFTTNDP
ncbi:MAG TPA: outer membrane efflux protein, partial [Leptospiraceae bacterium]|nr:outer membrane efflux protein [Leptospiraceae bacterium]